MGEYSKAEYHYLNAKEIGRKIFGEKSNDYAKILNNLGTFYHAVGNYSSAEDYLLLALDLRYQIRLEHNHSDFAETYNNLANFYIDKGDFVKAQTNCRSALEIWKQTMSEKDSKYVSGLANLARIYSCQGDYGKAIEQTREAISLLSKTGLEKDLIYANLLHNLADAYFIINENNPEALFQKALEIRISILGENHPDVANTLNSLAVILVSKGEYSKAEEYYIKAKEIYDTYLGKDNLEGVHVLYDLGMLYYRKCNYEKSEALFQKALEIRISILGENHPDVSQTLHSLSALYIVRGESDKALDFMHRAIHIEDFLLTQIFSISSERQRMVYLNTIEVNLHAFISLILNYFSNSDTEKRKVVNLLLKRRAISLEASTSQREAIMSDKYPNLSDKFRQLKALRMQIGNKTLGGARSKEELILHEKTLEELNEKRENLEIELANNIPETTLNLGLQTVSVEKVADALPAGSVLIEYFKLRPFDYQHILQKQPEWKSPRYLALLLVGKNRKSVYMIDLGEARIIDDLINKFRYIVTDDGDDEFRKIGYELRTRIFEPFSHVLESRQRLFVVPDGELTRLPLDILPTDNKGEYLTDKYEISYLTSGRDLIRMNSTIDGTSNESLVIANPDFDLSRINESSEQIELSTENGSDLRAKITNFELLKNTEEEAEHIGKKLSVIPWTRANALEGKLKKFSSPYILHIATHGFFLYNKEQNIGESYGQDLQGLSTLRLKNPLLRSGLALAGANTWINKGILPPEAEDGILTAEDVFGLDLSNTELVVLSACETGLGEVYHGEGVFGLRRSFVLAGARSLIISLWKVPGEQTIQLMKAFYDLIEVGETRLEALRKAQKFIRSDPTHSDPFYWGAFICQGDSDKMSLLRGRS